MYLSIYIYIILITCLCTLCTQNAFYVVRCLPMVLQFTLTPVITSIHILSSWGSQRIVSYDSLKVAHSVPAHVHAPPPLISTCSAWHL